MAKRFAPLPSSDNRDGMINPLPTPLLGSATVEVANGPDDKRLPGAYACTHGSQAAEIPMYFTDSADGGGRNGAKRIFPMMLYHKHFLVEEQRHMLPPPSSSRSNDRCPPLHVVFASMSSPDVTTLTTWVGPTSPPLQLCIGLLSSPADKAVFQKPISLLSVDERLRPMAIQSVSVFRCDVTDDDDVQRNVGSTQRPENRVVTTMQLHLVIFLVGGVHPRGEPTTAPSPVSSAAASFMWQHVQVTLHVGRSAHGEWAFARALQPARVSSLESFPLPSLAEVGLVVCGVNVVDFHPRSSEFVLKFWSQRTMPVNQHASSTTHSLRSPHSPLALSSSPPEDACKLVGEYAAFAVVAANLDESGRLCLRTVGITNRLLADARFLRLACDQGDLIVTHVPSGGRVTWKSGGRQKRGTPLNVFDLSGEVRAYGERSTPEEAYVGHSLSRFAEALLIDARVGTFLGSNAPPHPPYYTPTASQFDGGQSGTMEEDEETDPSSNTAAAAVTVVPPEQRNDDSLSDGYPFGDAKHLPHALPPPRHADVLSYDDPSSSVIVVCQQGAAGSGGRGVSTTISDDAQPLPPPRSGTAVPVNVEVPPLLPSPPPSGCALSDRDPSASLPSASTESRSHRLAVRRGGPEVTPPPSVPPFPPSSDEGGLRLDGGRCLSHVFLLLSIEASHATQPQETLHDADSRQVCVVAMYSAAGFRAGSITYEEPISVITPQGCPTCLLGATSWLAVPSQVPPPSATIEGALLAHAQQHPHRGGTNDDVDSGRLVGDHHPHRGQDSTNTTGDASAVVASSPRVQWQVDYLLAGGLHLNVGREFQPVDLETGKH